MSSRYRLRKITILLILLVVFVAFALFVNHVVNRYLLPYQGPSNPGETSTPGPSDITPGPQPEGTLILISELMASNKVGVTDEDGDYSDWLEITNYGTTAVDLAGYHLSESTSNKTQWKFPSVVLEPGEVLLVFASDKDRAVSGRELHTNFKLSTVSQRVYLYASNGDLIDLVSYTDLKADYALVRTSAETGRFEVRIQATPGFPNTDAGLEAYFAKRDQNRGGLVINEVMSTNFAYLQQSDGEYYDWVELKNRSSSPIHLSDYYMSNKYDKKTKWRLPDKTLAPGESYVIIASGVESLSNSQYKHANFRIDGIADQLYLFSSAGDCVDCLFVAGVSYGGSYGRMDGAAGFFYFATPSPGQDNAGGKRLVASAPVALTAPGSYNNVTTMEIALSGEGAIYYTLDGSVPTSSSFRYTEPFRIDKTTVVRSFSVVEGKVDSWITTSNYFINENHTLPVVNIATDPDNLWDWETGIYVLGPNASDKEPYYGANFHQDWEKRANISFYDGNNTGFSADCGLKIFGDWGRAEKKKSFQVKFRSKYGTSSIEYALFESQPEITEYSTLVVRSGSQDSTVAMMRDELLTAVAAGGMPSLLLQAQRHCVLYLNGEFWGIYILRERINAEFVAAHENVSPESVTLLKGTGLAEYGDNKEFMALKRYVSNHDMRVSEYYEYVKARLDFESTIDWFILEAYSGNKDLSNVRYYKSTEADGKFHWILFDLDMAMLTQTDPVGYMMRTSGIDSDITTMTRHLLKNDEFRDLFFTRLSLHCKTTLSTETVLAKIDELYRLMLPDMERDQKRWNRNLGYWQGCVQDLRDYVSKNGVERVEKLKSSAISYFGLTEAEVQRYFGS